jgi:hypothetical protein
MSPDKGPRSELARYAFGYSDEKPSLTYWLIIAAMFGYVGVRFVMGFP